MLEQKINDGIKQAMLAKEKDKLSALRAIKSELLLLKADNPGAEITEEMEVKMLQRMVKQRKESAETYQAQGREDLSKEEKQQMDVISAFLPAQLSGEEVHKAISDLIAKSGVSDIKGMGKIIGMASKVLAGKTDNKQIADVVKKLLSK